MVEIIDPDNAAKLVAASEERRNVIKAVVNAEIEKNAIAGHSYALIPRGFSRFELEWLIEELALKGYKIDPQRNILTW